MTWIILLAALVLGVLDNCNDAAGKGRYLKPFLMPLVMLSGFLGGITQPLLYSGLLGGWLGDLFLMKHDEHHYLAGVLAFLLGHVCYGILFLKEGWTMPGYSLFVLLLYLGWILLLLHWLLPSIPANLLKPCILYAFVLLFMSFSAFLHACCSGCWSAWLGSLLFCVSDSLLAVRGCGKKAVNLVMTTYVLAQILILAAWL